MNLRGPGRSQPVTMLLIGLALIGGIEISNVLQQSIGHGLLDAMNSGLLLFSTLACVCVAAGFVPERGRLRRPLLWVLYAALSVVVLLAVFSWVAFWITGRPINADAMGIIFGSPFEAALHLLSSDPLMLLGILAALGACLYGIYWLLKCALRAALSLPQKTRVLLCALFGALACFACYRVSVTDGSRSSYAAFLSQPVDDVTLAGYSCPRSPDVPIVMPQSGGSTNRIPVIVLMMESLRSDLGTRYSAAMPNVARIAKDSMVFERAYATASHSDYEDLSFWYSRYPLRADHRLGYPPDAAWRGLSVFEYFKLHGYSTAYFSSQNEKWGDMVNWLKIPAVDTYFDSENFTGQTWENPDDAHGLIALIRAGVVRSGKVEDSRTLDMAAEWIEKHASEPFFIGLNLQNTHYNYFIPEAGSHPYQPDELGFRAVYSAWPREKAPVVRNRYLNAAYNMDAAVGVFADRLKKAGIWDRAIVLMIGDGGEAFYEHGFGNHSGPMYEEVARTLAVLKLPKGDPRNGTKFEAPISHVDFVPALVDATGMQSWPSFQGEAPWKQRPNTPVYLTANAIAVENSVIDWPWKLMVRKFPEQSVELYNLATDPTESKNELEREPAVGLQLLRHVESWRRCQISYYADAKAYTRLQPPRFGPETLPPAAVAAK